jgi:MoaA/NifB/PqqE/SkfB family radical SAM enzyme
MRECTLEEIKLIAENFAKIGVAIILLTGGEPFVRTDLPEIIYEFESRGIHVRMQTNGLATEEQIHKCVEFGGKDISISLDSLHPRKQDDINGGFPNSWERSIRAVSLFTKYLPPKDSFASFGCVIQPLNLKDVPSVIRFGSAIGWYTSLVPIHITDKTRPLAFRTFDQRLRFRRNQYKDVDRLLETVKSMRNSGFLLYDSDQYLEDINRFIQNKPITWRKKRENICDSPNLYFAVLPNGDIAPCCDYRMSYSIHAYSLNFPTTYKDVFFRNEVRSITGKCEGCMYGSYPEMTISMRYLQATLQRFRAFTSHPVQKNWPLSFEQLNKIAWKIENEDSFRKQRL